MYTLIIFLGICVAFALGSNLAVPGKTCEKIVGCYYTMNTGNYTTLVIEDIDVSLCTHIFYSFVELHANASVESFNTYADIDYEGFKKINNLRKKNPHLKTLVVLDYSTDNYGNQPNIIEVITDPILREKLIDNIVNFLKKYGFNGIDLKLTDLPQRGVRPSDKENLVSFLKALREKFDKEGLILSATVSPNETTAEIIYDIEGISTYLNFINLRTFDFHGISDADKKVGHTAPIYPSSKENAEESKKNIDYVVKYWISHGAPLNKLILGTDFSGISYTLSNPKQIGEGSPFTKEGEYDHLTGYYEICDLTKKWTYLYDEEQKVPYIYQGNQIIAYEDVQSIKTKAEYANKMNLGGVMVWTIDMDDFSGLCGDKFPLLKTLNQVIRNKC